ncbi:MAG: hypothetical protein C4523_16705 [Myxococcales bacterium]|nr:MAG: hypothetical protein C4523_16705 [Myxococcales bacterium]
MLDGNADLAVIERLLGGYPRSVVTNLAEPEVRQRLAARLVEALELVRVENAGIPRDAWRPFHALPELPPDKEEGLPTGLAVSGILLNAALYSTDQVVSQYLSSQEANRRGAIVRFADDMIVLSRSPRGLLDLIEAAWHGLAGNNDARLDVPKAESNLYLNFAKITPPAMHDLVVEYLRAQGWNSCTTCNELRVPPNEPRQPQALADWWAGYEADKGAASLCDAVERSTVGPDELGPFVTTLVARLSDIGRDTLTQRFGEGARDRLVQLHELARFDIDDQQVRADTRRTFAVNQLVRAWLPPDGEVARTALADIRNSVAHVLRTAPWKFALWRAVVRAAARRPKGLDQDQADREARAWLLNQLRRVAHASPKVLGPESWMRFWPEEDHAHERHPRDPAWRALYLSFHRTAFWHALAEVLRKLWNHQDRINHPDPDDAGPSPRWWTVRAVPEGLHDHVAAFLGATDQWVDVLYPKGPPDLASWSWELDQLVEAVQASGQRFDLAGAWRRAKQPGEVLMVPATLPWLSEAPQTAAIFKQFDRVCPCHGRARPLNTSALAHVRLGGRDHRLGDLLFPLDHSPRILAALQNPEHAVAIGVSLGCAESIGRDLVAELVPEMRVTANLVQRDPLALWEYSQARRVLLGHGDGLP